LIFQGSPVFRTGLVPSGSRLRRAFCKLGLAAVLASGLATGPLALAKPAAPDLAAVSLAQLPAEAKATHGLILSGGPFPYPKDGITFGNRESQLPKHTKGYYQEYTVTTPGSRNRGARRIVCGGKPPTKPEVCYYTDDHYASFRRIEP
jgi:ribonuclease T1